MYSISQKYAHGFVVLCFVVVMQSFIMNSREVFIQIHQGCFAGTGAIVRLPQCQWSKPDGYGKVSQCITTTRHSKAKTVCIFLGIYCRLWWCCISNGEQYLDDNESLWNTGLIWVMKFMSDILHTYLYVHLTRKPGKYLPACLYFSNFAPDSTHCFANLKQKKSNWTCVSWNWSLLCMLG